MDEFWSEIEEMLHYDNKLYIPDSFQADQLQTNHDDPLAENFRVEKIFELLSRKYYWPKMRADVKKYVQGYDIWISSKA